MGLKVLNGTGGGYTSDVIDAIEFATINRVSLGIDIINLSLGHPPFESASTDPLVQAVEAAVRAGIVVVASAGNNGRNPQTGLVGYAGISSPGNAPSALTVGAVRTQGTVPRADDRIPGFSSRGPTYYDGRAKPDIVAPGHQRDRQCGEEQHVVPVVPDPPRHGHHGLGLHDAQRHEPGGRRRDRRRGAAD